VHLLGARYRVAAVGLALAYKGTQSPIGPALLFEPGIDASRDFDECIGQLFTNIVGATFLVDFFDHLLDLGAVAEDDVQPFQKSSALNAALLQVGKWRKLKRRSFSKVSGQDGQNQCEVHFFLPFLSAEILSSISQVPVF
jgi:hypothetical protein